MESLRYAEERLSTFLDEIRRLQQSDFPYPHSAQALSDLDSSITNSISQIRALPPSASPSVVKQRCSVELQKAFLYLPLMGFILRSTNVRNAFEMFRPLLRFSKTLLGSVGTPPEDVKLLLSSEWQYSPTVLQKISFMPGYVLLGLPATESSNPLIIPLAGHELGHAIWAAGDLANRIGGSVVNQLIEQIETNWVSFCDAHPDYPRTPSTTIAAVSNDLYVLDVIQQAHDLALTQIEETFCDFVGVRTFGTGYFYAFAYLVAPSWQGYRPRLYPNLKNRASHMASAARKFGLSGPDDYPEWFDDLVAAPGTLASNYVLQIADMCQAALTDDVCNLVQEIVQRSGLTLPSEVEAQRIRIRIDMVVPAEGTNCIADIINAGWNAYRDPALWERKGWSEQQRNKTLKELLLKNIEIHDIELITA